MAGEGDEVAGLLGVCGLSDARGVVGVVWDDESGCVFGLWVVGFATFEKGEFEVVLDALAVDFVCLIIEFALAQQLFEGEVAAGFDLLLDQGRSLLGAVGTDLAVEGGTHVEVVGLVVERVFVFGGANRIDLIAPPTH